MAKAKKNGKAKKAANGKSKLAAGKRQLEIKGAERPTVPEIEALVVPYVETLYQRMELEKKEPPMREAIAAKMTELDLEFYVHRDGEVKYEVHNKLIDAKNKIAVKRVVEASE